MGDRSRRSAPTSIAVVLAGGIAAAPRVAAADHRAVTMHDLRDHFAACFQPPAAMAGVRVTFYFSIDASGHVVAQPRTVLFGFKGSPEQRSEYGARFAAAFARCLPLAMSPQLAASIPGKVYFLQYVVAGSGSTQEVLLRPFGSHGGGGGGFVQPPTGIEPIEPATPGLAPVRIAPVPAWAVRPPIRSLFPHRGIFVPIPPRFPRTEALRPRP